MWGTINTRETWWERKTGREYGFENHTAKVRRGHREVTDTSEEVVPSASRGRGLSAPPSKRQIRAAERDQDRAAGRELKQLKGLRTKLERRLKAEQAVLDQVMKSGNARLIKRAEQVVERKRKEIDEIVKQMDRRLS